MSKSVKIIECPRDAMQGIKTFIPTQQKIQYIQSLLRIGFDTIDFGSFVSPKAIPQMADTSEVLANLDLSKTESKLLAIVANTRGAIDASQHLEIDYLGFPFSISENFQMRNTHKTIAQSVVTLQEILDIADRKCKRVVAYLSMGFGNPYGDPWNVEVVAQWTERLSKMGVEILSLSDTIGSSTPETINYLFTNLIPNHLSITGLDFLFGISPPIMNIDSSSFKFSSHMVSNKTSPQCPKEKTSPIASNSLNIAI